VNVIKRITIVLLCVALLGMGGIQAKAQQSGLYFPQTGHNVVGEFWTFYQSVPDADLVFGAPLTEAFTSVDGSGLTVQYFQRVRFELHSDQPIGNRLQVTSLGSRLYQPGAPAINLTTPGACRLFPTGFGVCYDFLLFFDQHGGQARFGNPISAFEFQPDGRLVQYFERARFDWHPELASGQNVILAELGRLYFNQIHEDPVRLAAIQPLNADILSRPLVQKLHAMAFVWKAVTLGTDAQKVFVVVQDQALSPVLGATGTVAVRLAGGQTLTYPVTTDANGIGIVPAISFAGQLSGSLVEVEVRMAYQGLSSTSTTSFRIWH
jgi:hypothetical protein